MWYKDFKRVKTEDDPRFTLLPNGSLLIDPVHESDTGDYICRITQLGDVVGTSLREQRKDITVKVYGKFLLLIPFRLLWTIHKIARPRDLALQIEREWYWPNTVVEAKKGDERRQKRQEIRPQ